MSVIKSALGRTSVQGIVALVFSLTLCGLAWQGTIGAEGFLGAAALPLAWLFKTGTAA